MQAPATLSRQPTASDLNSRGADLAISAERPLRALSSDRPRDYLLESTHEEIDREDIALIAWARENNRFLTAQEVAKIEITLGNSNKGGTEHEELDRERHFKHFEETLLKKKKNPFQTFPTVTLNTMAWVQSSSRWWQNFSMLA